MWASATVYLGLFVGVAGLFLALRPVRRLGVGTRRRAVVVAAAGATLTGAGLYLPIAQSSVPHAATHLDEFAPAWQFREVHTIRVAASPARVFEAIRQVRADEIFLFRTLTWMRRAGRQGPQSILNPGSRDSLIDVATRSGFVMLADDPPRELVLGAVVLAPRTARGRLTADVFKRGLPDGFAVAAMNFAVTPDGAAGSRLTTETRVFATGAAAQRRFGAYWRVIYPGSAIIRRMWLRAIRQRAEAGGDAVVLGRAGTEPHRDNRPYP
jgi:hypothetical protein